jgi:hypothetical protein
MIILSNHPMIKDKCSHRYTCSLIYGLFNDDVSNSDDKDHNNNGKEEEGSERDVISGYDSSFVVRNQNLSSTSQKRYHYYL